MRSLTKVLLMVGAITMLSVTLALGFDENAIDHTDAGITTAYVSLISTGEGLTVALAPAMATGHVGTLDVENLMPDIDDGDVPAYYGSRPWSHKAFAGAVELANASTSVNMLRLRHNQSATDVMAAYGAELSALGYAVTEAPMTSNITVLTATKGSETVRLVFVRRGSDTLVALSPS